jgi:hypothetical protein
VTVQTVDPEPVRIAAEQFSFVKRAAGYSPTADEAEVPFKEAVMVAVLEAVIPVAVAVKAAEREPAGTVKVAGTSRTGLLSVRETKTPPDGAGWLSVSEQATDPEPRRMLGVQTTDEMPRGIPDRVTMP